MLLYEHRGDIDPQGTEASEGADGYVGWQGMTGQEPTDGPDLSQRHVRCLITSIHLRRAAGLSHGY